MSSYNESYNTHGYIYVLANPSMPNVYKVGRSVNGGAARAAQLFTTGVPEQFILIFEIYTPCCFLVEKQAHNYLNEFRISSNREFFKCIHESIAIEAVLKSVAECYGAELHASDDIFSCDDAAMILGDAGIIPKNPYWKRIRSLLFGVFQRRPLLLEQILDPESSIHGKEGGKQ